MPFGIDSLELREAEDEINMKEVEKIITKMITLCQPIKYDNFNTIVPAIEKWKLREYEDKENKVGLAAYDTKEEGISTLSIIATITDILVGKRLAFQIDNDGYIYGVTFNWTTKKMEVEDDKKRTSVLD